MRVPRGYPSNKTSLCHELVEVAEGAEYIKADALIGVKYARSKAVKNKLRKAARALGKVERDAHRLSKQLKCPKGYAY